MSQSINFFSSRAWNGFLPAMTSFASCAIIFDLLAWLAWHDDQGRLFDLASFVIGFPSVLLALLLASAFAWSIVGRVPFSQAFAWGIRLLPLAWAVPLVDFVRLTGGGMPSIVPYMNGWGILEAVGTAGILPLNSGLSIGVRFGIFAGVLGTAIVSGYLSKSWIKAIFSAIWFSVISICSMSAVSLAVFWNAPFEKTTWGALPVELVRRATSVLGKGYWWDSMYDRFPTAIDGQIDIATRLFSAIGALSVVVVLLALLFMKEKKQRSLIRYMYGSWSTILYVSSFAIGCIVAYSDMSVTSTPTYILAFFLVGYLVLALRLSSVLRRDVANLEQDERLGVHQPIVDGSISLDHAKMMAGIADISACVVGFALGWPIFVSVVTYLACAKLTRDRAWVSFMGVSTIFRVIGSAALAGIGYLFLTQSVAINSRLLMAMGIVAAIRLMIEWFWIPKFKGVGSRD
jgi:hypothetical protein